jgi:hypothetical protein
MRTIFKIVDRASLQVLKAERPDIDRKRSDLLKLQGEFQLRLRHLEKNLLQVGLALGLSPRARPC